MDDRARRERGHLLAPPRNMRDREDQAAQQAADRAAAERAHWQAQISLRRGV
jgi:hypothetical protein